MAKNRKLINVIKSFGYNRPITAIFTGGSHYLGVATKKSDLDLTVILQEARQDFLTKRPINTQKIVDFGSQKLDLKIIGTRALYKQMAKANPNVIPMVLQDTIKYKYSFINKDVNSTIDVLDNSGLWPDMSFLNPEKYRMAVRGITLNLLKQIQNKNNYRVIKQVDMVWFLAQIYRRYVQPGKRFDKKINNTDFYLSLYPFDGFDNFHKTPDSYLAKIALKMVLDITNPKPWINEDKQKKANQDLLTTFAVHIPLISPDKYSEETK